VFRRGSTKDLSITVAEFDADKPQARKEREEKSQSSSAGQQLGLTVSDLSAAQKKEFRINGGVRVEAAVEAAARAGLREGDVIVAIANVEIAGVREFEAMLAKLDKKKPVNVLFRRGDWAQYAVIRPPR
jgi:serine protease Do